MTRIIQVAAVALIDDAGRILLAQRPEGKSLAGLWEFPGGKLEAGETYEAALVRELKEELNIDVAIKDLSPLTFASHAYDDFHLFMPVFACRVWQGTAVAHEDQQDLAWVWLKDMGDYPMPPADVPLIELLEKLV